MSHIASILPILDRHDIDLLARLVNKKVLDVGTGDGDLAFFFSALGADVVAVDHAAYNNNGLEGFHTLGGALEAFPHDRHVRLIDVDVRQVAWRGLPEFDTAFCFNLLYHCADPVWILEQIASRTRELFLITKVFDSEEAYAYFYDEAECNNDASNWWCFSPKALERMLRRAGFRIEFMERLDTRAPAHPVDLERDGRMLVHAVAR